MTTQVQLRRGTTAQNDTFVGAQGEVTVDISLNQLRVHDGATPGGTVVGGSGGIPTDALNGFSQGSVLFKNNATTYGFGGTVALTLCKPDNLAAVPDSSSGAVLIQPTAAGYTGVMLWADALTNRNGINFSKEAIGSGNEAPLITCDSNAGTLSVLSDALEFTTGPALAPNYVAAIRPNVVEITTAGVQLKSKEGTNALSGVATLVAGTVTVSNANITASSRIFLTGQNSSGTPGDLYVSARSNGVSFTITSTSGSDTRSVAYFIVEGF